jgi:hypothetical protein
VTTVWREVGDRIWVRRYEPLDRTIGVVGDDAGELLLLIDTRASHRQADELRDELRQLPGRVGSVVNTTATGTTSSGTPASAASRSTGTSAARRW